jgi:hypothetical protein
MLVLLVLLLVCFCCCCCYLHWMVHCSASYKAHDPADGSFVTIVSSRGNDALFAAEVESESGGIKRSDVKCTLHLDYSHFVPNCRGGITCTKVNCMDIGGSIPGFIKKKQVARSVEGHQPQVDYMMTGKLPPAW